MRVKQILEVLPTLSIIPGYPIDHSHPTWECQIFAPHPTGKQLDPSDLYYAKREIMHTRYFLQIYELFIVCNYVPPPLVFASRNIYDMEVRVVRMQDEVRLVGHISRHSLSWYEEFLFRYTELTPSIMDKWQNLRERMQSCHLGQHGRQEKFSTKMIKRYTPSVQSFDRFASSINWRCSRDRPLHPRIYSAQRHGCQERLHEWCYMWLVC